MTHDVNVNVCTCACACSGVEGRDGPLVQKLPGKNSVSLNIPKCGALICIAASTPSVASLCLPSPGFSVSLGLTSSLAGHHADLMFSTDYDTAELKQARVVELEHIKTWIQEHAAEKQAAALRRAQ